MTNKIYQRLQKKRPRYHQEHNDTFCLFCQGMKKMSFEIQPPLICNLICGYIPVENNL